MIVDKANAALDSVYAADTPEALEEAYAAWAATYDSETASLGYLLPFLITAWVARHVPPDEGPLLDAGCGTGLSGPSLKALGYRDIAGLDLSDDMLKIAGSRNAYSELKQAMLGGPLPWPDGHFRAFFSTGVFTISHAPASGLHELVRITKKVAMPSSPCATRFSRAAAFRRCSTSWNGRRDGDRLRRAPGSAAMRSPNLTRW